MPSASTIAATAVAAVILASAAVPRGETPGPRSPRPAWDDLFVEDIRAFSHGCIRLEKPERLAEWVLGWTEDQVRDAEQGDDDYRVTLSTKIPVYIVYFTTYVQDGELYFGNDLYSRDNDLVKTVAAGALPSAETLRAIEALRGLVE